MADELEGSDESKVRSKDRASVSSNFSAASARKKLHREATPDLSLNQ